MDDLRGAAILLWLTARDFFSGVGSRCGWFEQTSKWNFLHFLTLLTEALILPRLQKYISNILIHNHSCQIQLLFLYGHTTVITPGYLSLFEGNNISRTDQFANRRSWECHELQHLSQQQSTFQNMVLERTVVLLCRFTHIECRHELTWAEFIIATDRDRAGCSSHSAFYYSAFLGSADWTKAFIPMCILAELQSSNQLDSIDY